MKSCESRSGFTIARRPFGWRLALLCVLTAWSAAHAETVRDNFETRAWGNNDGTVNWTGDWIEVTFTW